MSEVNPHAIFDDSVVAADAPTEARVAFLKKTYGLLLAAILVFAGTLFVAGQAGPVRDLAIALYEAGWILCMVLLIGGAYAVHAVAHTRMGLPVFFAYAFFFGLLMAPLIFFVGGTDGGGTIIGQAALITAFVFTGITAYVFKSGKDFAFLGGFLVAGLMGMLGLALAGMIFGFGMGIWYSYFGAALFAGYILYDTSNILRRFPTNAHVSAAAHLFVDVILLFQHILIILAASRD